mgnify:FL=1
MPEEDKSVDFAGLLDGYTKSDRYDQTEEDKELSAKLKGWFTQSHESKQYYERDWELYRLYL